eukprot:403376711
MELEDLSKNIPDYSQSSQNDMEINSTRDSQDSNTQYVTSFRINSSGSASNQQNLGCFDKLLIALNIDALDSTILPTSTSEAADSRTLLRQYEQMKGLVRFISLVLHLLSYLIQTVVLTGLVYRSMKIGQFFDRRKYFFLIGVTTFVTILYFFALLYVVFKGSKSAKNNEIMSIVEKVAEIVGSISSNDLAFIFAIFMNFILIFGLYLLNMTNVILLELAKQIEQRRTGGRKQNELELNRLVHERK